MKRNLLNIKKIVTIVILVLTLILIGSLYNTLAKHDKIETVAIDQAYVNQFPDSMPYIVLDPTPNFPFMK